MEFLEGVGAADFSEGVGAGDFLEGLGGVEGVGEPAGDVSEAAGGAGFLLESLEGESEG